MQSFYQLGVIFKRSDIHFSGDDAHRFLPWLVGVMACLSALLLCLGVSIDGWIVNRHEHYSNSFTVNIPARTEGLAEKLPKIREALRKLPGVTSVAELSDATLMEMLKPWLGSGEAVAGLPLPAVIDVVRDAKAGAINYTELEKSLAAIAPGAEVDAHERWVAAFADFSAAAQALISIVALLILLSMAAMIAFASRTSLKLHAKTVLLLHAIGADDDYITRQFQQEAFRLVLPGALAGCALAGLAYWGTGLYMAALPVSLMPSLGLTGWHWLLLLLMPFFCASAAWTVAHLSVARQLQRVL